MSVPGRRSDPAHGGRVTARAAIAIAAALLAVAPASADLAAADRAYAALLGRYVTTRGVRYDAWRANGTDLKTISEVVTLYRSIAPGSLDDAQRKALYINLYNAKVLEVVLLSNPRTSIRDLSRGMNSGEVFSRGMIHFDGKTLSLNDLEKRLREERQDPRVHFALNCAARSCPPLRMEPYAAPKLDAQLDDATRMFLAAPGIVTVDTRQGRTTITTSKLFDWYEDDFKPAGGVIEFLRKYGPAAAADAIARDHARLEFQDYDWSLDEAK